LWVAGEALEAWPLVLAAGMEQETHHKSDWERD
jgi:hypothetical protein